jgi:hypothetical protein
MKFRPTLFVRPGLFLLFMAATVSIAVASTLEDLIRSDEPITYEKFLEAATAQLQVEDIRACEDVRDKQPVCRRTPEGTIHEKARYAYAAHTDRLQERAFQRRQAEDATKRAQLAARVQELFQKEYDEKIAASRDDPTAIELTVGTALCEHHFSSPSRALVMEMTTHRTAQLRLYTWTRRGAVEDGSGEVIVRRHSDDPQAYELEILRVIGEYGQVDLVLLGTTKMVVPCRDQSQSPRIS